MVTPRFCAPLMARKYHRSAASAAPEKWKKALHVHHSRRFSLARRYTAPARLRAMIVWSKAHLKGNNFETTVDRQTFPYFACSNERSTWREMALVSLKQFFGAPGLVTPNSSKSTAKPGAWRGESGTPQSARSPLLTRRVWTEDVSANLSQPLNAPYLE